MYKFLSLLRKPYLWLTLFILIMAVAGLESSQASTLNNRNTVAVPTKAVVQAGVEEAPLLPLVSATSSSGPSVSNSNPATTASAVATTTSATGATNTPAVTTTATNPTSTSSQSTTTTVTAPTNCQSLFAQPGSTQPTFLETAEQVCLKSGQLNIAIAKATWKLSIANGTTNKIEWQEPNSTGDGKPASGDLAAYGAPAFLVNKQAVSAAKAAAYQNLPDQTWFRLTRITSVKWQAPSTLILGAATNDPTGRTATAKFTLVNNSTLAFNLELSDTEGVVSSAVSGQIAADEHFFGLGQRQLKMDQRGQRAVQIVRRGLELDPVKGTGSYAPYPFVLSTEGYGLLAETQRRNVFDMGATRPDATLLTVDAANLNLVFFVDSNPLNILQQYTGLIGRPPMPPPWNFGVWKNTIGGQERVTAEAQRLRDEQIPVSVLFMYDAVDPQSGTGWDTPIFKPIPWGTYSDLPALNRTLHGLGYKTLTYVQESVETNWTARYQEGVAKGYFVRNPQGQTYLLPLSKYGLSMIDFSNPAAVKWFQDAMKRILVDFNFDGALQDTGEMLPFDAQLANGQSGYAMANVYPVLYAKAAYDAAQQYKPDAVFLMRSAYLGSQQYQKATWEGDLINHWDWRAGLPSTIPAALNRSISGSPFIGTEIAGFLGVSPLSYADRHELYLRWTQYGAFNPIMRDILGQQPADAVYMWTDNETVANFKRYARVHTDLFPLLYTLAQQAHATGLPIMRHPYLLYPKDPKAISQELEYFLGDSLLVAPVVTMGARERPVYLPQGQWVDFWSGQELEGGRDVTVPAPLDTIPVYVKAGAILPTLLQPLQTLGTHGTADAARLLDSGLKLKIYGRLTDLQKSSLTLFDNTNVSYIRDNDKLDVAIAGGNNQSRPYRLELPADSEPTQVEVEGNTGSFSQLASPPADRSADVSGWWYDATQKQVIVIVKGSDLKLHLQFSKAGTVSHKSAN